MIQKEISIYDFKRGDIITRLKPSKPFPGSESLGEDIRDRAHIGKPLIFLGIANSCVYVEKKQTQPDEEISGIMNLFNMFSDIGKPINLPLDMWDEGWSYYIDPYSINGKEELFFNESKDDLEKDLKIALEKEDYKKADEIQKRLDRLK